MAIRSVRNDIVELLLGHVTLQGERVDLMSASWGAEKAKLIGDIDISGPPKVFAGHFVDQTLKYGRLENGQQAIEAVLHYLRTQIGEREQIDQILEALRAGDEAIAPPYKGLRPYDTEDAHLFFGRTAIVERMLGRVLAWDLDPQALRFLAVVGASGSGKSSLVKAGLIPKLREADEDRQRREIRLTPGATPLHALAWHLLPPELQREGEAKKLAAKMVVDPPIVCGMVKERLHNDWSPAPSVLLFVDQFEELFTARHPSPDARQEKVAEKQRQAFVAGLLEAASEPAGPVGVVITLRSDYYHRIEGEFEGLWPFLQNKAHERCREWIGAVSRDDLVEMVVKPAELQGYAIEKGLTELIVNELEAEHGRPEPGALPLLSHALYQTWLERSGFELKLADYQAKGGVKGAIGQSAEQIYSGLAEDEKKVARELFLRLTQLGEEAKDTRRRVFRKELGILGVDADTVERVLTMLINARLIVTDRHRRDDRAATANDGTEHVYYELAHEALIRKWERLRKWLGDNREALRQHQRITDAERRSREDGELLSGLRLQEAEQFASEPRHKARLNPGEWDFLQRSLQRRRRNQILRWGAVALIAGLVVVIVGLQLWNNNNLVAERDRANEEAQRADFQKAVAEAEAERAELEARRANARLLVAEGRRAFDETPLTGLALVLEGLALVKDEPPAIQRSVLEDTGEVFRTGRVHFLGNNVEFIRKPDDHPAMVIAYSPRGGELYRSLDSEPVVLADDEISAVHFSPDGTLLVVDYENVADEVRRTADGSLLVSLLPGTIERVKFGPAETLLVVDYFGELGRVPRTNDEVLRVTDGTSLEGLEKDNIVSVTFGPQGSRFIVDYYDAVDEVWDIENGDLLAELEAGAIKRVYFSPDGSTFVVAYGVAYDGIASEVRQTEDGALLAELKADDIKKVYFSPDGSTFVVDYENVGDEVRRTENGALIIELNEAFTESVTFSDSVTFSADGTLLAVDYWYATDEVRRAPEGTLLRGLESDYITKVYFSPVDGVFVVDYEHIADEVRRVEDGARLAVLKEGHIGGVYFSPDGSTFVVDYALEADEVRRTADGDLLQALKAEYIDSLTFSPDGSIFVVDYRNEADEVRQASDGTLLAEGGRGHIMSTFFSPDGTLFALDYQGLGGYEVRHVQDGKLVQWLEDTRVGGVSFTPDGSLLIVYYPAKAAEVRRIRNGILLARLKEDPIAHVRYSPDDNHFVVDYQNAADELWSMEGGTRLSELGTAVEDLYWLDDQRLLLWHSDGRAYVLDLAWLQAMSELDEGAPIEAWIELACKYPMRNFVPGEVAVSLLQDVFPDRDARGLLTACQ